MRLPDASPRSEAKKTAFPAILASTLVRRGAGYPRIAPKSPRQTAASYSSHPSCSSQPSPVVPSPAKSENNFRKNLTRFSEYA